MNNNRNLVSDNALNNLIGKINDSDFINESEEYEDDTDKSDVEILSEELVKIQKMIYGLRNEFRKAVKEEVRKVLDDSIVITENSNTKGDKIHIVIGGHQFSGNVKLVEKTKK